VICALRSVTFAALTAAALACDDAVSAGRAIVRDSAGVRIVESSAPQWESGEEWTLEAEPLLDFGPGESLFRIGSVRRLADGRIIVPHLSATEILVYSAEGERIASFGRAGSGPGEFGELSAVFPIRGDSILVYDIAQLRASVFDRDGQLARTFTPPSLRPGSISLVQGAFDDGSLLVTSAEVTGPDPRGLVRPLRSMWRIAPDGGDAVHLVDIPGEQRFFQESPFGPPDMRRPFFGHTSVYVAAGERLYWAATDTFEIRVHAQDGRLLAIFRKQHDYVPLTTADVEPLITRQLANVTDPNAAREARRMLENLPIPQRAPAFGWPVGATRYGPELQVDEDGNIWVVEFSMPDQPRNARIVFDSSGVWLGTVELPERFAPTQIGRDFVVGTWRDSVDVEHVRMYRLNKD
jgi:hypothetical protein